MFLNPQKGGEALNKIRDWIYANEWFAWVFLAACIIFNFAAASARKPKIVKDTAGLLSSSVEKQIKNYNDDWEDDHETRVAVAFLKKDTDAYDYFKALEMGENDHLMLFICEDDDSCELKYHSGANFSTMYNGDTVFRFILDSYRDDVEERYLDGNKGEINALTGELYDILNRYFNEVTTPQKYVEDLSGQQTATGFIGRMIKLMFSIIGSFFARLTFKKIVIILIVLGVTGSVIGKSRGGRTAKHHG